MRNSDPTTNPILAPTTCYLEPFEWIMLGAAVIGVVTSGVSLVSQQSAASQAASNAQAIANYNANIQRQNAETQYQIQLQQAEYTRQSAQANQMLASYNARAAEQQGQAQKQFFEYNKQIAEQRYQAQLQQAGAFDEQAQARRAESREEARRLREENEQRLSMIRGKYAASGVAFEGSPLVVLSDAARLAETAVQDQFYVGELEARQKFRAAEVTRFEGASSLVQDIASADISTFNAQQLAASQAYEAQIQGVNFENQILAAQYDTFIADAERRMALSQASLTALGGEMQASNIRAESTANLVSGIGGLFSSTASTMSRSGLFDAKIKSPGFPNPYLPTRRATGVIV